LLEALQFFVKQIFFTLHFIRIFELRAHITEY
jgi:hypothetical protein